MTEDDRSDAADVTLRSPEWTRGWDDGFWGIPRQARTKPRRFTEEYADYADGAEIGSMTRALTKLPTGPWAIDILHERMRIDRPATTLAEAEAEYPRRAREVTRQRLESDLRFHRRWMRYST